MSENFYALPITEREARLRSFALNALSLWPGKFGDLALAKFRENAVFSVRRDDGVRVALRIHRHDYHSAAAVSSELQWMHALGVAGIDVPEVVPARSGAIRETFWSPELPEPRLVDMLTWLDGTPVSALAETVSHAEIETLLFQAGALAARLHAQVSSWTLPRAFERPRWDTDGLIGDEPLWGRFWELPALSRDQADLLNRVRITARADLAAYGENSGNFGLIHADLIPDNLLSHDGRLRPIDFDDSGFGWYMFDVATILFPYLGEPFYGRVENALFEGYRAVRVLNDVDQARLPLFMLLRGLTYLGWIQTRADTQTARDLEPLLIDRALHLTADYLTGDAAPMAAVGEGG